MRPTRASLWQRLLQRAPRRLAVTRAGKCLIAIALAAGLAALNTGNNALFLAWGMVLGAMVVSGVLSEAVLRPLSVTLRLPDEVRSQVIGHLRAHLHNSSRFVPAMAIEVLVSGTHASGEPFTIHAPYELRLDAQRSRHLYMPLRVTKRGVYTLTALSVRTAYPFGLFIKERPLPLVPQSFVALPAQGGPQPRAHTLQGQHGDSPAGQAGDGEDYFATRPYRMGDPLKHVLWRRVAKTGRWLVVEREARRTRRVGAVLAFDPKSDAAQAEAAICAAASWMEQALADGLAIGLDGPGVKVLPRTDGPRGQSQRRALLTALALMDVSAAPPSLGGRTAATAQGVWLTGPGLQPAPRGVPTVKLIPAAEAAS